MQSSVTGISDPLLQTGLLANELQAIIIIIIHELKIKTKHTLRKRYKILSILPNISKYFGPVIPYMIMYTVNAEFFCMNFNTSRKKLPVYCITGHN